MKVVLIKRVDKIGLPGEVKEVADGYARNFLIPSNLAVLATEKVISDWRHKANLAKRDEHKELSAAKKLAKTLNSVLIEIKAKANKAGTLFGAVTLGQILEALKNEGIELDKKYLIYSEPIKKVGEYEIGYKLADGSEGKFKVRVESE